MDILNESEIKKLATVHDAFCISIYIPTHRFGEETFKNGVDQIQLKNQLKTVKNNLKEQALSKSKIQALVQPIEELLKDDKFWRNQSDGLALFLSEGVFKFYSLPVSFTAFNYVSNEFFLKPLLPLFNQQNRFFQLLLSENNVKLYEETQFTITEIKINDLIPQQLEDVVGYDFEKKNLQVRTQPGQQANAIYHGHNVASRDEQSELQRYFRAIDKGIMTLLHDDQKVPLVLACLDHHYPIYKSVTTHQHLYEKHVSINSGNPDVFLLHEKSKELLKPYFEKIRNEKIARFLECQGTSKTTSKITNVLPEAMSGRVDTLFIERNYDQYGIYFPEKAKVELNEQDHLANVSLTNLVAVNVFLKGGKIILTDENDLPGFPKVNALLRY